MKIKINDLDINYVQYGEGKDIVLLHGWGQNIQMMQPIGDALQDNFKITILDLPGFQGKTKEPSYAWTLDDYALMLEDFINALNIKKPIIMGHSFGGRLAIKYSSNHIIEKLVLFASPIKPEQNKDSIKVKALKTLKKLPGMNAFGEYMKNHIGSRDYKNASPIMRQVLVNTVNENLIETSRQIEEPTLLIWGDNDEEASIEDAKILESIMKDAGLVILPGTHYAYLENINQVITILKQFIQ